MSSFKPMVVKQEGRARYTYSAEIPTSCTRAPSWLKQVIRLNNELFEHGYTDLLIGFHYDEQLIHDPFLDMAGLELVNPVEYYGEEYVSWFRKMMGWQQA